MTDEPYTVPPPGCAPSFVLTPQEIAAKKAQRKAAESKTRRGRVNRDRWQLLNRFIDDGMAGRELSDAAVWFALFRHAKADGTVTVAQGVLLTKTGLAKNTVKASIQRLLMAGWLERMRRGGPTGGIAVYRLRVPHEVGQ